MQRTRRIGDKIMKDEVPILGTSKVYEFCLTPNASILQTIVDRPHGVFYLWDAFMERWQRYDLTGRPMVSY
jgi:hypothetical protein